MSHEFGHFIVARRNGIGVEEFGFGFPPRILGIRRISTENGKKWQVIWRKKQLKETLAHHTGTIYSVNLIPLGGFVRIKGEHIEEQGAHDPDSFLVKKTWQKAAVIAAGVLMNVLVATVLLSISYMVGMPQVAEGENVPNSVLKVVQVFPDRPAAAAGIQPGDNILQINGVKNPSVQNFQNYVNDHRNEEITFVVEQGGKTVEKKIRPAQLPDTDRAGIGVALVSVGTVKYSWYKAIYEGVVSTGEYLLMIFTGFWVLLKGLFGGSAPAGSVAGPVGVAVLTGQAAQLGLAYLLQFTAILSLNLAVLNILPIPALDGGRLFFIVWNRLFRRPVPPRIEQVIHTVGFMLLMFLVVLITVQDLNIFGGNFKNWWNNLF